MDLLFSCFITNKRSLNRYDRLDVFKYTLATYKQIEFEKIYLFIELDEEFSNRKNELEDFIYFCFDKRKVYLEYRRILNVKDWKPIFDKISPRGDDKTIFFMQNDDHPFIDFDPQLLYDGIKLFENDISKYKCISISHWPESINGAYLKKEYTFHNKYINFKTFSTGSMAIYNLNFLKYIFLDFDWKEPPQYGRMDNIANGPPWIDPHPFGKEFNDFISYWVPLRELCRHFDGYPCQGNIFPL